MDIFFSDLDRKNVYKLPIIPETMPQLSKSSKNEKFNGGDGTTYKTLGGADLVGFTIDCWLPEYEGKYAGMPWLHSQINPYNIINMWSLSMKNRVLLRCIQVRNDNSVILDWLVTVEKMTWYPKQNRDIAYSVDFEEYNEIDPAVSSS